MTARSPAGPTVGLAMIVKNEAQTLPRLAASLEGQLDHWVVVDTGSSDDTVAVAEAVFAGVPGRVVRDEWRGYGPSRNVALRAARPHTDWVLTLDADDTVHGSLERAVPDGFDGAEAAYHVDPLRYWVPRIVRSSAPWEWRARAHEYLTLPAGPGRLFRTSSFYVEHHADGGNRSTKFERELALLKADYRDAPSDPRTLFYLARTYEDGGQAREAARWYRRRVDTPGWEEETWYALWRLGVCVLATGAGDEGCGILWRAWGRRPWRAEPLWSLAEHYRLQGQWTLGFEAAQLARRHCGVGGGVGVGVGVGGGVGGGVGIGGGGGVGQRGAAPRSEGDRLFVHRDVYEWRIDYEQSISAYYVGERDLGRRLVDELLARTDLPGFIRENLQQNQRFYRL